MVSFGGSKNPDIDRQFLKLICSATISMMSLHDELGK